MSDVTRDVTRDMRRESRTPTRPDPNLTEPALVLKDPRGDFSPHRHLGNARESGDVMVSATRIDTDLTTIEHLDFDPAIPCECRIDDGSCSETAELILQDTPCRVCGVDDGRWLCSLACWDEMATDENGVWVICVCGAPYDRDETLRIIGRIS